MPDNTKFTFPTLPSHEDIYQKELGASYWFVTHKILLKKILTNGLIIINIGLIILCFYLLIDNLIIKRASYYSALVNFASTDSDYVALRSTLPQPIAVGEISILSGANNYDIAAAITNSNAKWWASFDYQFQLGQGTTAKRQGFVLPGETKMIVDLGVDSGQTVSGVILSNVLWYKEINYAELAKQRSNFDIQNIKFLESAELNISENVPINKVIFDVSNLTAYNYQSVGFIILLKSGSQVAAINKISTNAFGAGEKRTLEATFFQQLSGISKVEIIPEVNFLDKNSFLKF